VDTCRNAESAPSDPALFTQAHAATREFNIALRASVGQGASQEREELRIAATRLMRVVARVLLRTE
jgi:hypothetical protein